MSELIGVPGSSMSYIMLIGAGLVVLGAVTGVVLAFVYWCSLDR